MSQSTYQSPMPVNEMDRLEALADLDLDYTDLQKSFSELTKLAAKVAGTDISMINLIDMYTQWTVSNFGLDLDQMPREDSVCQHTIMQDEGFEVNDLSADDKFKDKFYVTDAPNLKYYYGLPLQTSNGSNIGALCVLDTQKKDITPEKSEMLKIIADEIVNRLRAIKAIQKLKVDLKESNEKQKRVAHDIRGPVGGIIGLARIIAEQGDENTLDEVLEFITMIQKSGHSILELADEILSADNPKKNVKLGADEFNQLLLKEKLEKLYTPQAINKQINFKVITNAETEVIPFSKNKLLQIIGNLVSNSMKFTPISGSVTVRMEIKLREHNNDLHIFVEDTGVGMDDAKKAEILSGDCKSTDGTCGENGYGFGLALVKHLVDGLKGSMNITSVQGQGTTFEIVLPQGKS
ncbi:GAF domain-containing sensor histidine kinase [Mucilaginibacter myungsuensis]|uniref:histidine kinase n=1 Tax=Mucilaginibacter myungsuensis TaxID=649104 RepID=A0A929L290_9SPHI|nr:GAF domain-containing sensor histidine kinase [Mucilaginibacter myungsuensis]MBE9664298.1 GAF domain-containing sensor histidine kinase [Mucilaginibacter myungsuensis]MDN3597007.1 GAF domain-containing sensor histidine kinase [Mucilaginibacter myungsuensis]